MPIVVWAAVCAAAHNIMMRVMRPGLFSPDGTVPIVQQSKRILLLLRFKSPLCKASANCVAPALAGNGSHKMQWMALIYHIINVKFYGTI